MNRIGTAPFKTLTLPTPPGPGAIALLVIGFAIWEADERQDGARRS